MEVATGCIPCRFSASSCLEIAQSLTSALKQAYPLEPIRWSYLGLKASEWEEVDPLFASLSFSSNREVALIYAHAAIEQIDNISFKKLERSLEFFNRAYRSALLLGKELDPAVFCELTYNRAHVMDQVVDDKYR